MPERGVIDLSHEIESGMITHPGLPAPLVYDFLSREESRTRYANGTEFHIGKIEMVANTGTYIDSPFHRFSHGKDISELTLSALVDMPCTLVRLRASAPRAITAAAFADLEVRGRAVLVHTGGIPCGASRRTSRTIRISPRMRRCTWPIAARPSWGSIR